MESRSPTEPGNRKPNLAWMGCLGLIGVAVTVLLLLIILGGGNPVVGMILLVCFYDKWTTGRCILW